MPRKTKEDLEKDAKNTDKKSKASAKTKVNSKVVANPKSKTTSKPKKETKELKEKNTKVKTTKKDVVEKKSSTKKVTEENMKSTSKKTTDKKVVLDNAKKPTKKTAAEKVEKVAVKVKKETVKKPVEKKTVAKAKKETTKGVVKEKAPAKVKKVAVKKTVEKKTPTKAKKETVKKTVEKKTPAKANKETAKKTVEKKTPAKAKKETVKKTVEKKAVTKTKKGTTKRTTKNKEIDVIEYYDLPYRYNKTLVKILAQTPNTLFVYWDISDDDRKNYVAQYGEDFFNNTSPVLLVHNKTKKYSFEFEINDFANSWYFNVADEKCEYVVELGRRPRAKNISIPNGYLHITSSNIIESPNDHILFENEQKIVYFRNVITNMEFSKDIANLNFLRYMGRIYNIYDLYHKIYNDEAILDLKNPSSRDNPTSRF